MINYNDLFVSSVAMLGSASAFAVAVGPWREPYRLRTIAMVVDRYGMTAARAVWISIALISLSAGVSIARGIRPGFAQPSSTPADAAQ
ncbi:hypothetical protein [Rhodopirellula sp. MGV]|uniref:hypothetical protein n=1 Tax=Rhodopirellula sp. MGV TaxID=2023130 RepID=UPI000B96419D|nr:hypothetical protein [Rhodopirellula sp. MGV]OYP37029.1 hypothetical protein CGZ80_06665 [Rhodopirellula sp. MGV]PNY36209.1 hypothetical protein C2E31_13920 [Rhodopirellula baltica]